MIVPTLLAVPIVGAPIYYAWRAKQYTASLTYVITDRRLLILRNGQIDEEVRPEDLEWVERRDRKGAPDFSDLIWKDRPLRRGGNHGRVSNPVTRERSKTGFKAQPQGEYLLQLIESWRQHHLDKTTQEARDFVESRHRTGKHSSTGSRRIANPAHGFSIEVPEEWDLHVRTKNLVFGETGIDWTEDQWSNPEESTDWNLLRAKNAVGTAVEVQVHETRPINTLEQMANPKLPKFLLANMELIEQQPKFAVNGLQGFYLTRLLKGKGSSEMRLGESSDLVQRYQRQYIFHDGQRQFYAVSVWPRESPEQGRICESIVSTLRPNLNSAL